MPGPQTPTNWLALIGEWDFSNVAEMRFNGQPLPYIAPDGVEKNAGDSSRRAPEENPSYGIALSDLTFSGGTVEAEFTFSEFEKAVGELILDYNPTTRAMLTAGIGGWPGIGVFSVREWVQKPDDSKSSSPAMHWNTIDITGDRNNIEIGKTYHVCASLRGSQIGLTVNGIQVILTQRRGTGPTLSSAGLFCGSVKPVKAANFVVTPESPHAFVVMQFSAPHTDVYPSVIRSVCAEFGITAIRADELYGPGVIVQDIVEQVVSAQLVIADISEANANVYFEVGYALASKKPIILLAKKGTALPFDVSGFRVLFYEDSIGGKAKVEDGLRKHLTALVGPAATRV